QEMDYRAVMGTGETTPESFVRAVRKLYGDHGDEALKLYTAATADEAVQAATDLASDRFIGYSTWKWFDLHRKTGGKPVYRYLYCRPRPPMRPEMGDASPGLAGGVQRGGGRSNPMPADRGAVHSAEIEYAMGNLATNHVFAWTPEDYRVSEIM